MRTCAHAYFWVDVSCCGAINARAIRHPECVAIDCRLIDCKRLILSSRLGILQDICSITTGRPYGFTLDPTTVDVPYYVASAFFDSLQVHACEWSCMFLSAGFYYDSVASMAVDEDSALMPFVSSSTPPITVAVHYLTSWSESDGQDRFSTSMATIMPLAAEPCMYHVWPCEAPQTTASVSGRKESNI